MRDPKKLNEYTLFLQATHQAEIGKKSSKS